MKSQHRVERILKEELQQILPAIIAPDSAGGYQLFAHYRLITCESGHEVFCNNNLVGVFGTTRAAVSWCIAHRHGRQRLARDIETTDRMLSRVTQDLQVRTQIAAHSKHIDFRDHVQAKLETKLLRKKQLENHLKVCVNLAKYIQQRGIDNETARTGLSKNNQTNRSNI
jgi:hypothetical protein